MTLPEDRSAIQTEGRNPRTMHLHTLSVSEIIDVIHREDDQIQTAIQKAKNSISQFIESMEPDFFQGGRLIYIGAGTSGRLGVLDASEAPPTFQLEEGRIIGVIAGGEQSLRYSSEGKEDIYEGAKEELMALKLTKKDAIVGIAAGGTTPYVHGALDLAKNQFQCRTALLTCSSMNHEKYIDHMIFLDTGPEVLTGSTRMKAGTATKQVLNMISTTLMIREGRVYENLMVDLKASNNKLCDRAARIISTLTGLPRKEAFALLNRAEGSVKTALVMEKLNLGLSDAKDVLLKSGSRIEQAFQYKLKT